MNERHLKFETLERRLLLASDFGDAPAPYDTLLTNSGAQHETAGPMLGATRDQETDGIPDANAQGDDIDGVDDEDGIIWGAMRAGQLDAPVTVVVQNATGNAFVDAWIDFNGDGNWADAGEHILAGAPVSNGNNVLQFDVPSDAKIGTTYARVRLSSIGFLGPTGATADGEVEDYEVSISSPLPSTGRFLPYDVIPNGSDFARSVSSADLDDDGDMDVVSASGHTALAWHENRGEQGFALHVLRSEPGIDGFEVHLNDIDSDGDIDILAILDEGNFVGQNELYWYENDGSGGFTEVLIDTSPNMISVYWVASVDLDKDGDVDILAPEGWYENDGSQNFTYDRKFFVDDVVHHPIDLDRDGDIDLVSTETNGGYFGWYENDGNLNFTAHFVSSDEAEWVAVADVDADGDIDLLANREFGELLSWYENDGAQNFSHHQIPASYEGNGRRLAVADMEGDGDVDVVAIGRDDKEMWWFANDGNGIFSPDLITNFVSNANSIVPADMDGDGDLDIISAQSHIDVDGGFGSVVWHENVSSIVTLSKDIEAVHEDSAQDIAFTFHRTGILTSELVVEIEVGGTARFGTDYVVTGTSDFDQIRGSVVFPADSEVAQLTIAPLGDTVLESNETILFRVARGSDYVSEEPEITVARIIDGETGDFGDAPVPYSTLVEDDGARHLPVGPTLGSSRDTDPNGQPSTEANGDDQSNDDEDGVTFGPIQVAQFEAMVIVNVQNSIGTTFLDAWIDFDGDGSWSGNHEHIAQSVLVQQGDNTIYLDVPASASSGTTFARFRLSTSGNLGSTGAALDGEVEDYLVSIAPPKRTYAEFGNPQEFADGSFLTSLSAADLDGDGDLDALASSHNFSDAFWYENLGCDNFEQHSLLPESTAPTAILAIDVDSDSDTDIVTPSPLGLQLFENQGQGVFEKSFLTNNSFSISRLLGVDLDRDGDMDIVAGGHVSIYGGLAWYENTGSGSFVEHVIATDGATSVVAIDLDHDSYIDIATSYTDVASPSPTNNSLKWYRNDGNQQFTVTTLETGAAGFTSLHSTDLNGDGLHDLVFKMKEQSSEYRQLAWYQNDGGGAFTRKLIDRTYNADGYIESVDPDGDGDRDLFVTESSRNQLLMYKNDGSGVFEKVTLDSNAPNVTLMVAGDYNGDGDIDLLTSRSSQDGLFVYDNLNIFDHGDFDGNGRIDGLDFLALQRGFGTTSTASLGDGDANGDHCVNGEDLSIWERTYQVTADFDSNHRVDGLDFLTWQRNVGSTEGAESVNGDSDGDGDVDGRDLRAWEGFYSSSTALGSASIPTSAEFDSNQRSERGGGQTAYATRNDGDADDDMDVDTVNLAIRETKYGQPPPLLATSTASGSDPLAASIQLNAPAARVLIVELVDAAIALELHRRPAVEDSPQVVAQPIAAEPVVRRTVDERPLSNTNEPSSLESFHSDGEADQPMWLVEKLLEAVFGD